MNACSDNQLTRIGSTTPTNRLRDSRSCALEKEEQEDEEEGKEEGEEEGKEGKEGRGE